MGGKKKISARASAAAIAVDHPPAKDLHSSAECYVNSNLRDLNKRLMEETLKSREQIQSISTDLADLKTGYELEREIFSLALTSGLTETTESCAKELNAAEERLLLAVKRERDLSNSYVDKTRKVLAEMEEREEALNAANILYALKISCLEEECNSLRNIRVPIENENAELKNRLNEIEEEKKKKNKWSWICTASISFFTAASLIYLVKKIC